MEKKKVFELDFGDTNLLSQTPDDILQWIKSDMCDMKNDDTLQYTITIRMMTQDEINNIPEWS